MGVVMTTAAETSPPQPIEVRVLAAEAELRDVRVQLAQLHQRQALMVRLLVAVALFSAGLSPAEVIKLLTAL